MNWLAGQIMLAFGWRRALFMLLAGILAGFSVPPFFVLPALFAAMPMWVWALDGAERAGSWGRVFGPAFRIGFFFGLGYFLTALHWLGAAFFVDGGAMLALMPFGVVAVAAAMAIFWGLASAAAHWLWIPSVGRILVLATSLTIAEFVRGHILTGLPFDLVGYALTANEPMMQAASLVGVYGLTFVATLISMTPALIWPAEDRSLSARMAPFFGGLAVIAAQVGYGHYRINSTQITMRDDMRMRLIQPNIDQSIKWQAQSRDFIVDRLMTLSQTETGPADRALADITHLIWPEAALPFYLADYPEALARFARMLPPGTTLLTGAPRQDNFADAQPANFNSVLAIDENGEVSATYDKSHLVPVGEFLPFKSLLASLGLRQFVPGLDGWTHGSTPRLMTPTGSPAFLSLICYEAIFSGDLGEDANAAQFMLNVTNDGWFDGSIGADQHFWHARLRTVESGLPMVRVANTGVTAVIDPLGRVTARIANGKVGLLDADMPNRLPATLFSRWSHWPLLFTLTLSALMAVWMRFHKRPPKSVT